MDADSLQPVRNVRAVIERHDTVRDTDRAPYRLHLCMASGEFAAATWHMNWRSMHDDRLGIADVALVNCAVDDASDWVATSIQYVAGANVLDLIPATFGAEAGIVDRFRDVVGCIASEPLARFIQRVWTRAVVFRCFWTCPASRGHHHADRGGLARHSIEMAENVSFHPSVDGNDRDLAIAYALLHDIGKLWCHGDDACPSEAQLGHELVAIARLARELDKLQRAWPDGAAAMRSLLAGLWKTRGQRPLLAIGKLVQAEDQLSVERDLRAMPQHRFRPWTPTPASNVVPFPDCF